MVLSGDHHIFYTCIFRYSCPLICIEINRIEFACYLRILFCGNLCLVHNPFATSIISFTFPGACQFRIQTPMDKHSEFGIAEPLHFRLIFFNYFSLLPLNSITTKKNKKKKNEELINFFHLILKFRIKLFYFLLSITVMTIRNTYLQFQKLFLSL